MKAKIIGTGSYAPSTVLTNKDLEQTLDTSDKWIVERTGVSERRIAAKDEATSDLAVKAGQRALSAAGVSPSELDLIIVATTTPDMFFPSTACLVLHKLMEMERNSVNPRLPNGQTIPAGAVAPPVGAVAPPVGAVAPPVGAVAPPVGAGVAAFDLGAACSGFVYALSVGEQYILSGKCKKVLVIGADLMSRIVDWTDRSTCVLFGDGAGAVLLAPAVGKHGILSTHIHSDGSLWNLIAVPGGGSADPPSERVLVEKLNTVKMKGGETFKAAVRTLEEVARETLSVNGVTLSDVAYIVPHQANIRIIKAVAERLDLDMDKVVINLARYGNTSAASIPLALDEAVRDGRIKENDLILLLAFGSGLTWGSALIRF